MEVAFGGSSVVCFCCVLKKWWAIIVVIAALGGLQMEGFGLQTERKHREMGAGRAYNRV